MMGAAYWVLRNKCFIIIIYQTNVLTVFYAYYKHCKCSKLIISAYHTRLQLIVAAPCESSMGGSKLNIQIQGHFKKMDIEYSAVDSCVKTRYTLLDHNKRFRVICFSPTLSTFKNEFPKIFDS